MSSNADTPPSTRGIATRCDQVEANELPKKPKYSKIMSNALHMISDFRGIFLGWPACSTNTRAAQNADKKGVTRLYTRQIKQEHCLHIDGVGKHLQRSTRALTTRLHAEGTSDGKKRGVVCYKTTGHTLGSRLCS